MRLLVSPCQPNPRPVRISNPNILRNRLDSRGRLSLDAGPNLPFSARVHNQVMDRLGMDLNLINEQIFAIRGGPPRTTWKSSLATLEQKNFTLFSYRLALILHRPTLRFAEALGNTVFLLGRDYERRETVLDAVFISCG